jgi:hypothetical protein
MTLAGVLKMWQRGQEITAMLVALCTAISQTIYISFILAVLLAVLSKPKHFFLLTVTIYIGVPPLVLPLKILKIWNKVFLL